MLVLLCALRSLGAAVSLRSLGAAVCVWDRLGAWLGILLYFTNSASASYWGSCMHIMKRCLRALWRALEVGCCGAAD